MHNNRKNYKRKRAQPLRNSKANRAKWLDQAERSAIKLQDLGHGTRFPFTQTDTGRKTKRDVRTKEKKYNNKAVSSWR